MNPELPHHALDVVPNRRWTYVQMTGDVTGPQAASQQPQDLLLASREALPPLPRCIRSGRGPGPRPVIGWSPRDLPGVVNEQKCGIGAGPVAIAHVHHAHIERQPPAAPIPGKQVVVTDEPPL